LLPPLLLLLLLLLQRDAGYAGRKRDYSTMMQDNRCAKMCKAAQGVMLTSRVICPSLVARQQVVPHV
jgi:hypothetical protein